MPKAKVGILGRTDAREGDGSNASIGYKHEFGDPVANLPVRSFLREPIIQQMQAYLKKSQAFDKNVLKKVVTTHSVEEWIKKIAFTAEQIVFDAFNSTGFGKWKPSNMAYKTNKQTLVETQQLRNSITSEVE
jgi:hypothetical protein